MKTCKVAMFMLHLVFIVSPVLAQSGSDIQKMLSASGLPLGLIGLDANQFDASQIDMAQISAIGSQIPISNLPSGMQGMASDIANGKMPSNLAGQNASEILSQLDASQLAGAAVKVQEIAQNNNITLPPGVTLPDQQKISEALGSDAVKNAIAGVTVPDSIPSTIMDAIVTKKKSTTKKPTKKGKNSGQKKKKATSAPKKKSG